MNTRSNPLRCLIIAACLHAACFAQVANSTPPSNRTYRVAGTIVNRLDGTLLSSARVTLRGVKNSETDIFAITSANGRFEFTGVPAGKYTLTGAKRGFIASAYDQHDNFSTSIVTGAGVDTENLVLRIVPAGMIAGAVLDEAGDPVRNASVNLYREDRSEGIVQIQNSRGAQTDDLGAFEFTALNPGTYYLSVNAKPWYALHPSSAPSRGKSNDEEASSTPETFDPALDVAYPITYYPNALESDGASPIVIRGGERLQLDMHVTPVPSLRLRIHLPNNGRSGYAAPQFQQPAFDGTIPLQGTAVSMLKPGVLEIAGIPAGRYDLQFPAFQQSASGRIKGLEIKTDGQDLDVSAVEAPGSVKISVRLPGDAAIPKGLQIGLSGGHRSMQWRKLGPKADAEFQDLPAGRYELTLSGGSAHYSISRVEGAGTVGHSLTVAPGSSLSLTITLSAGSVEVEGVVKRAGQPFSGAMVVLVPANAEGNQDLFRRDQSDLDGTFVLHDVVPGSYTVLAIEDGWDLSWSEASAMAPYLKHGHPLKIAAENRTVINLPDPVPAQER